MQQGNCWPSQAVRVEEVALTVVEAVERDLANLAKRAPGLDESAEAATALALARELDSHNSATSKSMCARALNETMDKLRGMAPPAEEGDGLDELKARRAARLAR